MARRLITSRVSRRSVVAGTLLALPALLVGVTPLAASAGAGGLTPGARLQNAMNAFVAQPGSAPGIVVAIGRGNQFTLRTAGVANRVTKAKPQANDQMRMASVAKAFSGATALSLVSRGKLKLTDTVGKIVPKMPVQWKNVTLAQLLQHTSGIPDFSGFSGFRDALLASLDKAPAPRVLLSYVDKPALLFPSGTQYRYSNSDNILVGLMIQNVTGRSYEGVLSSNVLAPLHLTRDRPAEGYDAGGAVHPRL